MRHRPLYPVTQVFRNKEPEKLITVYKAQWPHFARPSLGEIESPNSLCFNSSSDPKWEMKGPCISVYCTRTKKSCLRHSFLVLVQFLLLYPISPPKSQPTTPPTPILHPANLCSQVPTHGVHVCVYVCANLINIHYRIERIPCKIAVAGHAGQPGYRNSGTHFPTCPA